LILSQQHLKIQGEAVISHFTFKPPLVAMAMLESLGCFIVPIHSKGKLYRADGGTDVGENQGVLMKCGTYVNKWYGNQENQTAEVIILRLRPLLINTVLGSNQTVALSNQKNGRNSTAVIAIEPVMKSFLDGLFFYFENPGLVTDELVSLKIKELALLLLHTEQEIVNDLLASLFHQETFSLQQIVDAHVFEHLSLQEMATLAHMSPTTFKRKFKSVFDTTYIDYVTQKRMQKAAVMLRDFSRSIAEVAYDCGYQDPGYFSKLFKRWFGHSPSDYRVSK